MEPVITKVPPLKCPACGSAEVSPGFTRRVGNKWLRDNMLWCYGCQKLTNEKTGKVEEHSYSSNNFMGGNMNKDILMPEITNKEFYEALVEVIEDTTVSELFQIPGFYELVSEEFNNEALKLAKEKRESA
jgi:hypothetical protein